jgi:hypothetical protein
VGIEARLAPPLPAPPPDLRLLAAALVLLAVALALVWHAAARLRRRPPPGGGQRQTVLRELERTKARATCPGRRTAAARSGAPGNQHPCADNVHTLMTEFAAAATGLPCSRLTTQELRACENRLPAAIREAFGRLLDALDAADLDRFTPRASQPAGICLVDAALAAVRNWPAEPAAEPTPAGSRELS